MTHTALRWSTMNTKNHKVYDENKNKFHSLLLCALRKALKPLLQKNIRVDYNDSNGYFSSCCL